MYWCFQVGRDEVCKDQVPDLPYLNATTWASHEFLHNPTAHNSPGTMTCPAVKLQDVARVGPNTFGTRTCQWCFHVTVCPSRGEPEVHKGQVPDLSYLLVNGGGLVLSSVS